MGTTVSIRQIRKLRPKEVTSYLHSNENDLVKREKMNDVEKEKGNCWALPVI